jgi:hypothetical protein
MGRDIDNLFSSLQSPGPEQVAPASDREAELSALDEEIARQSGIINSAAPVVDEPVGNDPGKLLSAIQQALGSFADIRSRKAQAIAPNPGAISTTNAVETLTKRRADRKATIARNKQRRFDAEDKATKGKATTDLALADRKRSELLADQKLSDRQSREDEVAERRLEQNKDALLEQRTFDLHKFGAQVQVEVPLESTPLEGWRVIQKELSARADAEGAAKRSAQVVEGEARLTEDLMQMLGPDFELGSVDDARRLFMHRARLLVGSDPETLARMMSEFELIVGGMEKPEESSAPGPGGSFLGAAKGFFGGKDAGDSVDGMTAQFGPAMSDPREAPSQEEVQRIVSFLTARMPG